MLGKESGELTNIKNRFPLSVFFNFTKVDVAKLNNSMSKLLWIAPKKSNKNSKSGLDKSHFFK